MCGIIGIIGRGEVAGFLVDGLKRLEYRGYDSAGVATLVNGRIERRRRHYRRGRHCRHWRYFDLPSAISRRRQIRAQDWTTEDRR
jgi:glucosamine--fructose-6-phosphate aminotransferase (isomerizing)